MSRHNMVMYLIIMLCRCLLSQYKYETYLSKFTVKYSEEQLYESPVIWKQFGWTIISSRMSLLWKLYPKKKQINDWVNTTKCNYRTRKGMMPENPNQFDGNGKYLPTRVPQRWTGEDFHWLTSSYEHPRRNCLC